MVVYSLDVSVSVRENAINGIQVIFHDIALTTIDCSFFFIKRYWQNINIDSLLADAYLRHKPIIPPIVLW